MSDIFRFEDVAKYHAIEFDQNNIALCLFHCQDNPCTKVIITAIKIDPNDGGE